MGIKALLLPMSLRKDLRVLDREGCSFPKISRQASRWELALQQLGCEMGNSQGYPADFEEIIIPFLL